MTSLETGFGYFVLLRCNLSAKTRSVGAFLSGKIALQATLLFLQTSYHERCYADVVKGPSLKRHNDERNVRVALEQTSLYGRLRT